MARFTFLSVSAVKVLSRAYTLRVVVVGDEELRNVAEEAGRNDFVLDVYVSSWAGVETKGLESVNTLGAVLALGL